MNPDDELTIRPRRAPLHPEIDEALIERLVRHFYTRVRSDPALGPVFAAAIPGDWEPHLRTMMDFWSSVTMMTGRYHGTPVPKHQALTDRVAPALFDTWLDLFRASAGEVCSEPVAAIFIDRAERIAMSLKLAMYGLSAGEERA